MEQESAGLHKNIEKLRKNRERLSNKVKQLEADLAQHHQQQKQQQLNEKKTKQDTTARKAKPSKMPIRMHNGEYKLQELHVKISQMENELQLIRQQNGLLKGENTRLREKYESKSDEFNKLKRKHDDWHAAMKDENERLSIELKNEELRGINQRIV